MSEQEWLIDNIDFNRRFRMPVQEFMDWLNVQVDMIPREKRGTAILNIDLVDVETHRIEIQISYPKYEKRDID